MKLSKCDKCQGEFIEIEEHHLWPKYMDNPHGYCFGDYPSRIYLDGWHHMGAKGIHIGVIIPILKKYSVTPHYYSESMLWKGIWEEDKEKVIKEVVEESWRWLNDTSSGEA